MPFQDHHAKIFFFKLITLQSSRQLSAKSSSRKLKRSMSCSRVPARSTAPTAGGRASAADIRYPCKGSERDVDRRGYQKVREITRERLQFAPPVSLYQQSGLIISFPQQPYFH